MKQILAFILSSFAISQTMASDHIDGPVTTKHRVADLSDLYVFGSPTLRGFTTIVLNSYPIVPKNGHYDSKLRYRIHIRKLESSSLKALDGPENKITIECRFITPKDHHGSQPHSSVCASSNGMSTTSVFNEVSAASNPLKVFHGMRSDPFFFNTGWAKDAMEGKLAKPAKSDTMNSLNILSLVVELDLRKVFPNSSLFGVSAEAFAENQPGAVLARLDRIGRPEITNVSMFPSGGNMELRDLYNLEDSFEMSEKNRKFYRSRLAQNISHYDLIDKKAHWTSDRLEELTSLLSHDYLAFDIEKPCGQNSFLEIERALLAGTAYTSCGGRHPNDDIMDSLYTLYISGLNGPAIRDGIDSPSTPIHNSFPYLAGPDLSIGARLKATIARKLLGL